MLKKINVHTAMDTIKMKHVTRDTVYNLFMKVIEGWRRTIKTDGEIKPSQTGAKRLQTADAPDTQEKTKSKAGGAVDDAVSNVLVVTFESEGEGAESSVYDAAPRHMQGKASVSAGRGGSAATAALSGEREERIRDKRKHGGEELLVPNDGKTRKTGPESTESGADGEGLEDVTEEVPVSPHLPAVTVMQNVGGGVGGAHMTSETREYHDVDQTIWAHLEFEDGQIVALKNSVSTSFYIGREPRPHEHHHRFYHEADNVWRRVSAKHCHILRLDTGSFAPCIFRLTRVLLILIKYVS